MDRRSLFKAAAAVPFMSLAERLYANAFAARESSSQAKPVYVATGTDATGTSHKNPWAETALDFKVLTKDTSGGLFLMEQRNMPAGGPRRHMHYDEDEWFYLIEGDKVVAEVGDERITLKPGDSVLAPHRVPHVWAYVGEKPGRMLVGFTPANKMQAFFEAINKRGGPLPPAESRTFGIEVLGPPLDVKKL
jgi:mannose-6-phosphate isomerase-like protein (cupin superfamily)